MTQITEPGSESGTIPTTDAVEIRGIQDSWERAAAELPGQAPKKQELQTDPPPAETAPVMEVS